MGGAGKRGSPPRQRVLLADADAGAGGAVCRDARTDSVSPRHQPDAARPDQARDHCRFQPAAAQLQYPVGGSPLPQQSLGAGQAVVLDRQPAALARSCLRPAAQHALVPAAGAAHRLFDPDGAAADRRRHHLESDLHARHQPAQLANASARLAAAGADHRRQLGTHRHHHRRHLGMVSLHHADDPGGAADDAGGAYRRRARRRGVALADAPGT